MSFKIIALTFTLPQGDFVDHHDEVLPTWRALIWKKRIPELADVIHFDSHPDIFIGCVNHPSPGTYLNLAFQEDMVGRLFWVIPDDMPVYGWLKGAYRNNFPMYLVEEPPYTVWLHRGSLKGCYRYKEAAGLYVPEQAGDMDRVPIHVVRQDHLPVFTNTRRLLNDTDLDHLSCNGYSTSGSFRTPTDTGNLRIRLQCYKGMLVRTGIQKAYHTFARSREFLHPGHLEIMEGEIRGWIKG